MHGEKRKIKNITIHNLLAWRFHSKKVVLTITSQISISSHEADSTLLFRILLLGGNHLNLLVARLDILDLIGRLDVLERNGLTMVFDLAVLGGLRTAALSEREFAATNKLDLDLLLISTAFTNS